MNVFCSIYLNFFLKIYDFKFRKKSSWNILTYHNKIAFLPYNGLTNCKVHCVRRMNNVCT